MGRSEGRAFWNSWSLVAGREARRVRAGWRGRRRSAAFCSIPPAIVALIALPDLAFAHGVSDLAKQTMIDGGPMDFALAGAEHMLTGYDHLLFLLGVLFLLSGFLEILKFATAFTLGHTITLLGATFAGVKADHFLIDSFIAVTVVAVGSLNLIGWRRLGPRQLPLLPFVFVFGLVHGFGLSTGMQEMTLKGDPGLVGRLLAFNVGVEFGQVAALAFMALVLRLWRGSPAWAPLRRGVNGGVVAAGLVLFALQIHGFVVEPPAPLVSQPSA